MNNKKLGDTFGAKLRVEQHGPTPLFTRVWLNDVEISQALTGLSVEWGNDTFTHATLRITVDDLEVDAETLAFLQARVEVKEAVSDD